MKNPQKSGIRLIVVTLLIVVATLGIAGCLESTPDQQSQTTTTNDKQSANPVSGTAVTTRTTIAPTPLITTQTAPTSVSSTGVIKIDLIGDKKTGDRVTLTGTTSLPAGTNLFWQIMPDTGIPPTGIDRTSQMSVVGNYLVTNGDGTSNLISIDADIGRLVPGKYVAFVGKIKGAPSNFETGNDFGYTYFTLK
ncbi:MAG: hypothetical protein WC342_08990 [Methanoregula sp.]